MHLDFRLFTIAAFLEGFLIADRCKLKQSCFKLLHKVFITILLCMSLTIYHVMEGEREKGMIPAILDMFKKTNRAVRACVKGARTPTGRASVRIESNRILQEISKQIYIH